eukprot:2524141-Alexandrium_andersonii.AAC.1
MGTPMPVPVTQVTPPVEVPFGPPPPPPRGLAPAGAAWGAGAAQSNDAAYAGPKLSTHASAAKGKRGLPEIYSLPEYPTMSVPGS